MASEFSWNWETGDFLFFVSLLSSYLPNLTYCIHSLPFPLFFMISSLSVCQVFIWLPMCAWMFEQSVVNVGYYMVTKVTHRSNKGKNVITFFLYTLLKTVNEQLLICVTANACKPKSSPSMLFGVMTFHFCKTECGQDICYHFSFGVSDSTSSM